MPPRIGKAWRSSIGIHESACLRFLQRGLCIAGVRTEATAKAGMLDRRFSASGLLLAAVAVQLSNAIWRATAKPMYGHPPRPRSRNFPSMVMRWTQLFEPPLATAK